MYGKGQFFCPFFVFIIMNFDRIIDQFHQGEFDPEEWFGDYETFFKILQKTYMLLLFYIIAYHRKVWKGILPRMGFTGDLLV